VSAYRFSLAHGSRSRRSLPARSQFLNTFAGIGYCLSFSLLAVGGYGIEEQFAPGGGPGGRLFSALLIATAATLLYCLLHPSRKKGRSIALWPAGTSWNEKRVVVANSAAGSEQNRMPMPLHDRYVDRTLLRIQR
jgi:hypothetical protein